MRETEDQTCEWNAATSNDINYTCALPALTRQNVYRKKKQPRIVLAWKGEKKKMSRDSTRSRAVMASEGKNLTALRFSLGVGDARGSRPGGGSRFSFTGVLVGQERRKQSR